MSNARGIADSDLSRLTVDSTTLVVDDTNNRVGIGTSSPACKTDVAGVIRSTSIGAPASGAGLELSYGGTANTADILAYDRTGAAFKNLELRCSNLIFNTGGGGERMRIDSVGRVTMPYQPVFLARGAGATPNTNGAIFPYSVAVHDVGGHYNTATYRFTAPVAGHYRFSYNCLFNSSSYGYASLHKNGAYVTGYGSIGIKQGSGVEAQSSATVVAYANAGDYFDVRIWFISSGYFGIYDNHASFSGELIG